VACTHDITERDVAVSADGYCPLCLAADNTNLRELLERAMRMWIHTESELAKDINAALKD